MDSILVKFLEPVFGLLVPFCFEKNELAAVQIRKLKYLLNGLVERFRPIAPTAPYWKRFLKRTIEKKSETC
jgi:hypothetical protein